MLDNSVESIATKGIQCSSSEMFDRSQELFKKMGITNRNRPKEFIRNLRSKKGHSDVFSPAVLNMLKVNGEETKQRKKQPKKQEEEQGRDWAWFEEMGVLEGDPRHKLVVKILERVLGPRGPH